MKTFSQYFGEGVSCPDGTKWCNKCGKCLEVPCQDKEMKENASQEDRREQQIQKKQLMLNRQKLQLQMKRVNKKKQTDMYLNTEGAAWTKKDGKNSEGGLNEKGRKSYERENPGSDLKAPSKKVGNPRRKSFCARMKGMKRKLTSKKTASDPDSRINKSLRAWNC
jgi:hypothetical protein